MAGDRLFERAEFSVPIAMWQYLPSAPRECVDDDSVSCWQKFRDPEWALMGIVCNVVFPNGSTDQANHPTPSTSVWEGPFGRKSESEPWKYVAKEA